MSDPPRDSCVFGIFGHSGSGKTTLIETLIGRLRSRGLSVAAVKSGAHGIDVDREGKDSDRFFRAGADVFLHGDDQDFIRLRAEAYGGGLRTHRIEHEGAQCVLREWVRRHDVILVEGRKRLRCEKVWLLGEGETAAPPEMEDVIATLSRDVDRVAAVSSILEDWLPTTWLKPPVYGCVLIGGKSTRMGRPKHLIARGGRTWLERACGRMAEVCERVLIVGAGEVPASLSDVPRLPDIPDASGSTSSSPRATSRDGPAAGILAAMRWAPWATWLVCACDLPDLSTDALRWLLSTRAPGVWATMPRLSGSDHVEPLLAHYDFRIAHLLEAILAEGHAGPSRLAQHPKTITPVPPDEIASAWRNVNTPDDL